MGSASIRLKRAIDLVAASIALVVLSPIVAVVALLVRLRLGSPVIFRQQRPGLNSEPFELLKFRSMRDGDGPDSERLTAFGAKLRSTSLDELPELWNIATGDMSFVGPRPLLMEYLPLYSDEQRIRHNVRPGLTGLAQVSGRNLLSWEERFAFDAEYVESRSTLGDLRILVRTAKAVVLREGVSSSSDVTMQKFTGARE